MPKQPVSTSKDKTVASKTKRIRYRRIVLRRPFFQPVKARKSVLAQGNAVKNPEQSLQTPQVVTELANADSTKQQKEQPLAASGPVASFEPGNNPYAYMVSQLPSLLGDIPNLVTLGEIPDELASSNQIETQAAPIVDKQMPEAVKTPINRVVEVSSASIDGVATSQEPQFKSEIEAVPSIVDEPSNAGVSSSIVAPKPQPKDEITATDSGNIWIDWRHKVTFNSPQLSALFIPQAVSRPFPWPGLPEQSCRQVRFGGDKLNVRAVIEETYDDSGFLSGHLNRLAQQNEIDLPQLLLFMSSVQGTQQFIMTSALVDSVKPCLSVASNSMQKLTVQGYFEQALAERLLDKSLNYLDCAIDQLVLLDNTQFNASQLLSWLELQRHNTADLLVELTFNEQTFYAQLRGSQVQLYGFCEQPLLVNQQQFMANLGQQLTVSTMAEQKVKVSAYQVPTDLFERLEHQFEQGRQRWQPLWSERFYRFVNLSD